MLWVANFPTVVIFFFGIFAFFLWRTFSEPVVDSTRRIFDFYINANSILRRDERRWFGFEVNDAIEQGESILSTIPGVPPLVYFSLGALYHKNQDHDRATHLLSYVVEDKSSEEASYLHPSEELRRYVKTLRKIEREPSEAPVTSAAVRSLERMRKRNAANMLEDSRNALARTETTNQLESDQQSIQEQSAPRPYGPAKVEYEGEIEFTTKLEEESLNGDSNEYEEGKAGNNKHFRRKSISEVLHDVYEKNLP